MSCNALCSNEEYNTGAVYREDATITRLQPAAVTRETTKESVNRITSPHRAGKKHTPTRTTPKYAHIDCAHSARAEGQHLAWAAETPRRLRFQSASSIARIHERDVGASWMQEWPPKECEE